MLFVVGVRISADLGAYKWFFSSQKTPIVSLGKFYKNQSWSMKLQKFKGQFRNFREEIEWSHELWDLSVGDLFGRLCLRTGAYIDSSLSLMVITWPQNPLHLLPLSCIVSLYPFNTRIILQTYHNTKGQKWPALKKPTYSCYSSASFGQHKWCKVILVQLFFPLFPSTFIFTRLFQN